MTKKDNETKSKNRDEKFKHGELREVILSCVGLGVLLGGTFLVTPNFPIIFASLLGLVKELTKKNIPENKIRRVLGNLEKKEILFIKKSKDEIVVDLKHFFTPLTLKYSLKPLLDLKKRKKKWDGKWFLVFFDVPEQQRNKRVYLREFLKDIGFYQYQKSVYIFPYECESEVALIKKIVEVGKYVSYVIADKIENERAIKTYFGLPS